ncbi:MFS transporter [Anaerocolumna aminovalerica]|uniref:MFS transporter, DHA3 family, macrolide efflux protein n=1 Tax=Anaerocolumna aminovalerica TaxID=1527 RepID=A0A1I5DWZ9_9FIRM|nr:MFS transporter [Anaerocolumna aminovalerica]MBU5332832.1 MFS transporter [Anaerocolumna aminovalerica]SFO03746.1 MFS transporter, DHA3 family, macrolide efflux protein [Anaerocolumna aminovalerica]
MKNNWMKNIILFLTSQTISLFGSSLVQYAIMWYITLETQSGIMMTVSIICGFLPSFFLSPFAGVWADRYNRKILIILSDSLIAAATFILAVFFILGYDSIWMLFVVTTIRAIGSGIQTPAVNAFLPSLVPEDKLTKINGLNGSIQAFVMLLSPMLSGALLSVATIETIFFIDVITALLAVVILLVFLREQEHTRSISNEPVSYFQDLKKGIDYINKNAYLKYFFLFAGCFFILAGPVAFLTPLQVARSFGDDVWRLTAIEVTFSIGMMAGGIIMASWGGFKNRVHTMTLSSLVMGGCTFLLGIISFFSLYMFIMGVFGLAMPFFNTPSTVLLQEKAEEEYLGRVFGIFGMIASFMVPLSMLLFGPLSDIIKIEWMLMGTGIIMLLLSFFLLKNKTLVEAGIKETT